MVPINHTNGISKELAIEPAAPAEDREILGLNALEQVAF